MYQIETLFSAGVDDNINSINQVIKVTGISIEAVPQIKNLAGGTLVGCSMLCGFIFGSDIATTYSALRTNNDSLLLNVGERTRKYISTWGSNGWHASADSSNIGVFGVASRVS